MIQALILRITSLQIGRKLLFLIVGLFLLTGCGLFPWENDPDSIYIVSIKNNTNDSLLLLFGEGVISDSLVLFPDTVFGYNNEGVDKGEDVIRDALFKGGSRSFEGQARVYRHDSLLVDWQGPGREMPDSIHHFYNYNSWETLIDTSGNYLVQFTIYDSDFVTIK